VLATVENDLVINDMLKIAVTTFQFITFFTDFQFETVAVVKESFPGSLQNLKGKKFCHPGFSKTQIWSDRILKVK
jgi:hypothetical protein